MKKLKPYHKVIIGILISIITIVISGYVIFTYEFSKVKSVKLNTADSDLGITSPSPGTTREDIVNILLFGDDRRSTDENGRSDSMMILSLNEKDKKIKLVSLMRDMYVSVGGHGMTKLTHAYSYGGAQLAIKTINQNLELYIRNYVKVDFAGLEKIVDMLGGVTIDVKEAEIQYLNSYVDEMANLEHISPTHVTKAGVQTLNGIQAVGYSRIRYVGNNDFERTERQRRVLTQLLEKINAEGKLSYPKLLSSMLPYVETSLKQSEILSLGIEAMTLGISNIEQSRVPYDGHYYKVDSSIYYMGWDKDYTIKELHKFLYE